MIDAKVTKMIKHSAALLALATLAGCTTVGVKPWQRDILARNVMQMDADGNITGYRDHIYFSKEAAAGGRSADGGGCGCN